MAFKPADVRYKTQIAFELTGNLGNGEITFTVVNGTGSAEPVDGGKAILPTKQGTIVVTATVAQTDNYLSGSVTATFTVQKGKVPIEFNEEELRYDSSIQLTVKDYDGPEKGTVSFDGINCETGIATLTADGLLTPSRVGTVTITVTVGATENYEETTLDITVEILPRIVTLNWTNGTYVYNGSEQAPTAAVTNLVNTDKCDVTVIGATVAGDHTAVASELSNKNYTLEGGTNAEEAFTIAKRVVVLSWDSDTFDYNGEEQAPKATVSNICTGDTCEVTVTGGATIVGNYTATATALSNENYTLEGVTVDYDFEILAAATPAELDVLTTVYGTDATLSISGNTENGAVSYSVTDGSGKATVAGNVLTPVQAGDVTVVITIGATVNFRKTTVEVTFTITPLAAVLEWSNFEFDYDGNEHAPTAVIKNLVHADDEFDVTVAGAQIDAGNDIAASADSLGTPNYTLEGGTNVDTTYTIKPMVAQLSWTVGVYTYNGEEQAPTAGVSNLLPRDIECVVTVSGAVNAGTTLTATATEISNKNYTLEGTTNLTHTFDIAQLTAQSVWSNTALP
ncbi:MAG: hypothetical protein K2N74_00005, partial [Clostridiales bacterium]|nr:hypothetical protein [Clostridiales bacterium]